MARVFTKTKSTRGKIYKCGKCSVVIKPGEKYRFYYKRLGFGKVRGTKYIRCMSSKCTPMPSELSGSRASQAEDIQVVLGHAIDEARTTGDCSGLKEALDTAASDAENLKDEIQSSLDNMPQQLQGENMQTLIEALENWQTELEAAASDAENEDSDEESDDANQQKIDTACDTAQAACDSLET